MAESQAPKGTTTLNRVPSCDAYFQTIQSRKKLPFTFQQSLTSAFEKIPVSSFPNVPNGQGSSMDWRDRYIGIIDYSAIILWVLENAELAAIALSTGTATAAGVGAGAVSALGAVALGATGPVAVAGLPVAAVGAAVAGGIAADKGAGKDAPSAAHLDNHIGGLPVVEGPNKQIIGNVSIRDIRFLLLKPELFSNFRQLTVMQFINTITSMAEGPCEMHTFHERLIMNRTPPITCKPGSSLGSVIDTLASKKVHRIYVAGENNSAAGVITL
ncbi:hypothetical protein MKX01_026613 [Papaver californicum]|nr:hypothetical protein MKX01_026613 [Papaver californicum]